MRSQQRELRIESGDLFSDILDLDHNLGRRVGAA
jgi:hypothetical protein